MTDEDFREDEEEEEESSPPYIRRLTLFKIVVVLAFALIVRQLWMLQIVEGEQYRHFADENRLRITTVKAPRGVMYDRDGEILVRNVPSYTAAIVPAALPEENEDEVLRRLAGLLGMPEEEVARIYREGKEKTSHFSPVSIKTNISTEIAFTLEERHLELPGVTVVVEPTREYREGPLTSHLVGYIGRITAEQYEERKNDKERLYDINDQIGQVGLEQQYEEELRGIPGEKLFEVDSSEREVGVVSLTEPRPGHNLVLSIDLDLQRAVTEILAKDIKQYGAASAIVMNPNNGQILAMVDLPTYDNNLFARGISDKDLRELLEAPYFPLINKSISSAFPPGSTFKIITAAAALQADVVTPATIIDCAGGMFVPSPYGGGSWLKCWAAHSTEDMIAGLADSCDTYFYQLAGGEPRGKWPGLGANRLAEYARTFGLGSLTGIDLPGEVEGLVPDEEWKQEVFGEPWWSGDTYIMGIGQGFLQTTPLQMLQAAAAIANGGTLYKPQVVMEIRDEENRVVREFQPEVLREVPVEQRHFDVIKEGLRAGMEYEGVSPYGAKYNGTSWDSDVPGIDMAGKTGTAESVLNEEGKYESHGWFVGFAPYKNPEIAVVVFVQKGGGPQHSAHLTADIMRYYFKVPEEKAGQP